MQKKLIVIGLIMVLLVGNTGCGASSAIHNMNSSSSVMSETVEKNELIKENYTAGDNNEKGSYYVVLPADYQESMNYPTVYLMPYDGYSADVYRKDNVAGTFQNITGTEAAQDMILILPEFSQEQDYDQMLEALVADVDEKYHTIAEREYRGILGVNVGAYMAYEAMLQGAEDLFFAAGAHMGDFTSEENPYLQKGDISALVNALDQKDSSKGYDYLKEHFFYLDAPNEEEATTADKGSTDIGSGLQKRSNPYYQWGYSMYAAPEGDLVSYAVLDGQADSNYYLSNLSRSIGAFSDRFSEHLYGAEMKVTARAVAESQEAIEGRVKLTFNKATEKFGDELPDATIKVQLLDETQKTVMDEQVFEAQAMQDTNVDFSFAKEKLQGAAEGYIRCQISFLDKLQEVDTTSVVLLQDFKPEDENPCIDLRGDWYFKAYKMFTAKKAVELDSIQGVTPEVYESWNIVQPGFGWWTRSFDSSLNGQENYAGYAWYVRTFTVDEAFPKENLKLAVGYFDEANEVYVNGKLIGSTGMTYENGNGEYDMSNPWDVNCVYDISASNLKYGQENTIAVRMCNSDGGGGWYEGPIGLYTADSYEALANAGSQRIREDSYTSAALDNQEETYRVYLPEGYEESGEQEYPVMYLLHGINSTSKAFVIDGVDRLLDEAIANGEIQPMIVVMPDDPTKQSFWKGSYARMVAEDLVADVEAKYRVAKDREHRYIAGCSMGGAGSMNIGLNYPDEFGGIISFYGALSYVNAVQTASKMSDEDLKSYKIWMACGNQDMYDFYVDQEYMSRLLTKKGVPHYHYIDNGMHTSSFYLPVFIKAIKYMQE